MDPWRQPITAFPAQLFDDRDAIFYICQLTQRRDEYTVSSRCYLLELWRVKASTVAEYLAFGFSPLPVNCLCLCCLLMIPFDHHHSPSLVPPT
jgi:hypothetical protein